MSKQIKARFNKKYVQENTFHSYRKMVSEVMCENPLFDGWTYNHPTHTHTFDADQFKKRLNQILTVKRELDWFVAYNWKREKEYHPDKQHNYGSVDNLLDIRDTLDFISDKWNCFMRVAWLVEVLDNYLAGMFDSVSGVSYVPVVIDVIEAKAHPLCVRVSDSVLEDIRLYGKFDANGNLDMSIFFGVNINEVE